jgi:hypothetical protein
MAGTQFLVTLKPEVPAAGAAAAVGASYRTQVVSLSAAAEPAGTDPPPRPPHARGGGADRCGRMCTHVTQNEYTTLQN